MEKSLHRANNIGKLLFKRGTEREKGTGGGPFTVPVWRDVGAQLSSLEERFLSSETRAGWNAVSAANDRAPSECRHR